MLEKIPRVPVVRNYIAKAISPDRPVVFPVDMGDIFSLGVELSWVRQILDYVEFHANVNFLFLTKNPERYRTFYFPKNTILGTSIDFAHNARRVDYMRSLHKEGYKVFVNIEPLMSRMDKVDFTDIDFVVIGALTGRKYRPDPEWHRSVNHPVKFYKQNLIDYFPKELKITR